MNKVEIEDRIQAYIDGLCTEHEAAEIAQNITSIPVWRETYDTLQEIHLLLKNEVEPLEPSMRFTKNVMEQVAGVKIAKPTRQYLNPIVVWMIGGIFTIMLVFIIGYAASLADWSSTGGSTVLKMPDVKMPAVDWGNFANSKTTMLFLFVNTVLGLALFDKWLRRGRETV